MATVTGIDNVKQAADTRLVIEQGTALLYPLLGLQRIVGTGQASADLQQTRLRIQQALEADPRIASVPHLSAYAQADGVALDITLELIGGGGQTKLRLAA